MKHFFIVAFVVVLALRFAVILARDSMLERLKEDFVLDLRFHDDVP